MLIGPRLCLCGKHPRTFLSGNGNLIEEFQFVGDNSSGQFLECNNYEVFCERKNTIHQLFNHKEEIFYAGENVIGFLNKNNKVRRVDFCLCEWITAFKLIDNEEDQCCSKSFRIAVLYATNIISLIDFASNGSFKVIEEVRLAPKSNIVSAFMDGTTWKNLRIFVGTISGDIYLYRPSEQSYSVAQFSGHNGPVFDIKLDNCILYSSGDDRSLRAWNIAHTFIDFSSNQLCEVYGHGARVYCVEIDLRYGQGIFTGSEDQSVCIWRWRNAESKISTEFCCEKSELMLFSRIQLDMCGAIRSMYITEKFLVACSDNGAMISVRIQSHNSIEVSASPKINTKILSFRCTDDGSIIFFVDETRTLYRWEKQKQCLSSILKVGAIKLDKIIKAEMLEIFDLFVIVTSSTFLYIVKIYGEGYEQYPLESVPISLVRMKFQAEDYVLVALLNGQCHIFKLPKEYFTLPVNAHSSFLIPHVKLMLRPKTAVMCAMFLSEYSVVLGTRNGLLLLISLRSLTVLQVVTKAHLGESVTDFFTDEHDKNCSFYSLGRDGYKRSWNYDGNKLRMMLNTFAMETPVRTFCLQNQRFIAGFFANIFLVLHVSTNTIISRYNCGGGNRVWQIVFNSKCDKKKTNYYFYFLSKGCLRAVELKPFTVQILKTAISTSNISCLRCCNDLKNCEIQEDYSILSGGIDGSLTGFYLNHSLSVLKLTSEQNNNSKNEIQNRSIMKQKSSIFDLDSLRIQKAQNLFKLGKDSSHHTSTCYTAIVGGRSEITLLAEQLENPTKGIFSYSESTKDQSTLTTIVFSKQLSGMDDYRIVAVRIKAVDDGNLRIYVICSDGSFRSLFLNVESAIIEEKQCIYIPHSLSIFWKLEILDPYLYLISTCGRLFCYISYGNTKNDRIEYLTEIQMEYNGLSSLAVFTHNSKTTFICVGSDAGNLTVVEHGDSNFSELRKISTQTAHSATITAVNWVQLSDNDDCLHIISTSMDCRISISVFRFRTTNGIFLINCLALAISDPSSMICFTNDDEPNKVICLVAGNGVETVEFDIKNTQNLQFDT